MRFFRELLGQIFQGWILREKEKTAVKYSLSIIFNLIFPDMIFQHILHTNFDLASRFIVIFIITNFCVKVKFEKFYVSCWVGDTEGEITAEKKKPELCPTSFSFI